MSYQLTVSEKPGYLHFTVTGPNTVANNRGMPMNVFETVAEAEAWLAARVRP